MASADSSHAYPTTFDRLCELCTKMFDGTFHWEKSPLMTHRDIYSLSKVAGQGCHICTLILASIPPEVVKHLQRDPVDQLAIRIPSPPYSLEVYACSPSRPPGIWLHFPHVDSWPIARLGIQWGSDDYTEKDRIPSSSNYSASTAGKIERWLADCIATHSECFSIQSASSTRDILPTRILDLKDVVQGGMLRLVATKELPRDTPYATLSHCWGGKCALTLKVDNLPTMEAGIAMATLPKTFRDAVSIATDLSIRYLWIDALCIVQDSADDRDWSHEASIMGDIYANSYITLTATTSPNSTGGLFHQRSPLAVWPCRVTANWNCFDRGNYVVAIPELVRDHNQKPLIDRAWAYQEWLLSKRLLHFSDDQVRWQCYCLSASEVYPNGLDEYDLEYHGTETKGIISSLRTARENHYAIWNRIRSEYSRKFLTKPSDRLAAFSGIARMAHKVLDSPPGDYIAGLWRPEMLRELLWTQYADENQPRHNDLYIAPTWSWASLNDLFWEWPSRSGAQLTALATVKDVEVVPVDDVFGSLQSAKLTLECSLSSVTLSAKTDLPEVQALIGRGNLSTLSAGHDWTVTSVSGASTTIRCGLNLDYRPRQHLTTMSLSYVPILYETNNESQFWTPAVAGLVLQRDTSSKDDYIRVGVLTLHLDKNQEEVLRAFGLHTQLGGEGITHGNDVVTII